jgi:pyruvate,water dikinase
VIPSLDDADRLKSGEILVCPATMPPWTPLFALASGIVTDQGGVLSHTAIVAREYRIPAVVGTKLATSLIKDGQTITVDGTEGTVRLES